MSAIRLRGLTLSEAEEAIMEVWSCLEEYGIPSPKLKASRTNSRMTIELSMFDDPLWAKLVDTRLSNWRRRKMERTRAPSTKKDNAWARFLEMERAAASRFPRFAEISLGAIAEINRKTKRRYV